ncbi:LPXTG cell wall anchor domain-containing protein [Listeria innocua]|uniref:InlB B-repeat-containing protein n=1 Tax=Listeria innocua TaxID=1642 RepID=UPI001624ED14|nr:InlB B-repeat-containing protein [Listeria innocua]MBC1908174.1 LPXTG cell wall anchor domain-containing protein [Listeria innocua]MBC1927070.1 LPXTG cell wall anchor domain-containing protein [Listeria innocua]
MDFKKMITQLMIVTVLVYMVGMPIQNSGLANEVAINETTIINGTITNEDKAIQEGEGAIKEGTNTTLEMALPEKKTGESDISNSESMESELAPPSEKEAESIEIASSETVLEEGIQEEKEISEEFTSVVTETASSEQQPEESTNSKEEVEVKEINQPLEAEKVIEKNVKAISPDKISVIFPDAALAEVIRNTLGKSSVDDVVTQAELDTITTVTAQSKGVVDISGVENLTRVGWLTFNFNKISDLSPVKDLKYLYNLQLSGCEISDISSLSNLKTLKNLYLRDNNISDISPLANLTMLNSLSLENNEISDISSLSKLVQVTLLELNNNQISDVSPLRSLSRLLNVSIANQSLTLPSVKWNSPLNVTNSLKDVQGNLIAPSSISNKGVYTAPTITWTGLANLNQSINYSWRSVLPIGNVKNVDFSGTVNIQVNRVEYNVNFDIDGQVTTESVGAGELVTKPQEPNKDGYAFTGWYDAESGGTKWDFSTDTMPSRNMTLYARFNKLGFVTPEIKPTIPTIVTPITPGVDPVTPSVEPPTTPGERPNPVTPPTPGASGNQISSNGSGSNTGNMTMTSQGNAATVSPTSSQGGKLAKLGEDSSLFLQGFGLLLVLSGMIFFWKKRKKMHL